MGLKTDLSRQGKYKSPWSVASILVKHLNSAAFTLISPIYRFKMFSKLTGLFKNKANLEEIAYLEAHKIQWDAEQGYIVDGILLNDVLAERLNYLSNRRMQQFDDLAQLYSTAMIINEKIDLEIAQQRFNTMLGNTEENLLEFKAIVKKLNDYYRQFLRDQK